MPVVTAGSGEIARQKNECRNREVYDWLEEDLPLSSGCGMDHDHSDDGYGTECLYVTVFQTVEMDSVKTFCSQSID